MLDFAKKMLEKLLISAFSSPLKSMIKLAVEVCPLYHSKKEEFFFKFRVQISQFYNQLCRMNQTVNRVDNQPSF